ncbi:MAG: type II toxin-antitoxin system VapC family toxin [Terracidiphilus sp.]
MQPVLLDTGVIVALLDRHESKHKLCVETVRSLGRPMVTCEAVIMESCYLLSHISGASEAIVENVSKGIFKIDFALLRAAPQIHAILEKYRDMPADFADACLIQMADELKTGDVLTLDRHFVHYRWWRNRPFQMLIPLR